jgi:hypothetical protein
MRKFKQLVEAGYFGKRKGDSRPSRSLWNGLFYFQMYRALAASHNLELAGDMDKVIGDFRGWSGKRKMPD